MKAHKNTINKKNRNVVELSQREVTLHGWLKAVDKLLVCESSSVPVTVSFSNVKYLCSAVLSSLMAARVQLRDHGLELVLNINTKELAELLEMIHLDDIFQVQYSEAV